jgi:hypothetical protein
MLALERSRGQALLGLSVSTTILALISCAVRFMLRGRISSGIWWDDYSIIVAMVSGPGTRPTGDWLTVILSKVMGFVGMVFNSIEASSLNDRIKAMEMDYLGQPFLMFGTSLAMISICFFFLRTIGRRRPWNLVLGMLTVLLAVVNLVNVLTANLQCRPLEKLWRPNVDGQCLPEGVSMNIGFFQGGRLFPSLTREFGGHQRPRKEKRARD